MGTRYHFATCKPCAEANCSKRTDGVPEHGEFWDGDGSFGFKWEHMTRDDALSHLQQVACACCGSLDWTLTDYSTL